jgi:hypothetical protein
MTLSIALNEAMTLNQIAAKELESGDDDFLKERREGFDSINNDIAAAAFATDMAKLESDDAIKEKLEEQAVYMLSVASEETKKILFKSGHFYEMAELNAAIKFSIAEKIINDAFEVCNEDKAKLNADVKNGASAGGGSVDVYSV